MPKSRSSNKQQLSKDVIIDSLTLKVPGKTLINDSYFKIAFGRRYGVVGINGSGKSTLLKYIAENTDINIDRFYVEQEISASDKETVYESVLRSNKERYELITKIKDVESRMKTEDSDELLKQYNELQEIALNKDIDKDESLIRKVLFGLGFSTESQNRPTKDFSGGWRMRMSLARALYLKPSLLLLDEPTNHLDLNATIWLTDYLSNHWEGSLLVVSHDKEFLNEVCTDIIAIYEKQIRYYTSPKKSVGVYNSYKQQFEIDLKSQEKKYDELMKKVRSMQSKSASKKQVQEFIDKQKIDRPPKPYTVNISFPPVAKLEPPVLQLHSVRFGYSSEKIIYKKIDMGIDLKSRITLVGPNGIGKSTLLKLIAKELTPLNGDDKVFHHGKLRIGYYHQHTIDHLPLDETPVEFIMSLDGELKTQDVRKMLGSIGLEGKLHTEKIETLSGGQKCRVALVELCVKKPHILLLDEPTNHLDIETIEALCDAINSFEGGVVSVTHDVDLILKTDSLLYMIDEDGITETDYDEYKQTILDELEY